MLKKLYFYFWLFGISILVYHLIYPNGILFSKSDVLKQSFSEEQSFVIKIIICFFFLIGFGYWLTEKYKIKLNTTLTRIHSGITLGITCLFWILTFYCFYFPNKSSKFINSTIWCNCEKIIGTLFLIAQLMYLINIFSGIIKKVRR